jgi:hypothetical protein
MCHVLQGSLLFGDWAISSWLVFPLLAFQIWMLVDAVRRQEWVWAILILVFSFLTAVFYYFLVYRQSAPAGPALDLPGSHDRHRIKDLQAQIHHLDKAHHHTALGEIYLRQGKFDLAEASFRAALERDPEDLDTQAWLGECLLHKRQPQVARPFLEAVLRSNPKHNYGQTAIALAETLTELGDEAGAIRVWNALLESHSYAQARVRLAELLLKHGGAERARQLLQEVIADDKHSPPFQRQRERGWVRQAKSVLARVPSSA